MKRDKQKAEDFINEAVSKAQKHYLKDDLGTKIHLKVGKKGNKKSL